MKTFDVAANGLIILLVCAALFPMMRERAFSSTPLYCSVEPYALSPLTDLNSSVYGLEIPATPSAVGDNFTVELHLCNATIANFPLGVNSIEVHFYFGNLLNYCLPIGFTDMLGTASGALINPILYGIQPGFYDASDNPVLVPPYNGAVFYEVAGASRGGAWNSEDGIVANITFQITKQPQGNEFSVNLPLDYNYTKCETGFIDPYTHAWSPLSEYPDCMSGSLVLDSNYKAPTNYTLTVQESPIGSGAVNVRVNGVTQAPPYAFSAGTVAQVTAIPNAGYSFSNWTLDGANAGFANSLSITMNSDHTVTGNFTSAPPPPNLLPVTLTAEPMAVPPLVDINSSVYGLEIPSTQVVVGDMFTVGLRLRNATQDNVPLGIGSIEVHFRFGSILDYLQPVSFANKLGAPDGVLNPDIQFAIYPGFHDTHGNETLPPYDGAVSYDLAASSTGTGWNSVDGLIAMLTFEITKQPQSSLGEGTVSLPMVYTFTSLTDSNGSSILHDCLNATITLDSVSHDIAVTNVTLLKTAVGEGYTMSINVTVANRGSVTEDFPLTVYANASVIDSQMISLISEDFTTVTFIRNTTGFAKGNYTIKAVAEGVLGEANSTDNMYTAGFVAVTIPGDINGDFKVDLQDFVLLALAYGSHPGDAKWNPNADIDDNGIVDPSDVSVLAQHYGRHYP